MKKIKKKLKCSLNINHFLNLYNNNDILFFDIETTGFSRTKAYVYLIGYIYHSEHNWYLEQILIQDYDEEIKLIQDFIIKLNQCKVLIHFNGDAFDIPFMLNKCKQHSIESNATQYKSIDLYKIIKPYKNIFNLNNCKLKSVEKFVGVFREDIFTGGELIAHFFEYIKSKDISLENNLLLHNKEDMTSLIEIMKIIKLIKYLNTLSNNFIVQKFNLNNELCILILKSFNLSPITLTVEKNNVTLHLIKDSDIITIKFSCQQTTMYYFFKDYKNYYYIPERDEAIHKSVAQFIHKTKKIKASASNCYIKKADVFVPLFNQYENFNIFSPYYKSKEKYILLNDIINNKNNIKKFTESTLKYILKV